MCEQFHVNRFFVHRSVVLEEDKSSSQRNCIQAINLFKISGRHLFLVFVLFLVLRFHKPVFCDIDHKG